MNISNEALWASSPGALLRVARAPYPRPGVGEVVVRTRAVALNPVDTMTGVQRRIVYPWLSYPAVLGIDVAGEVVELGPGTAHLKRGEQVIGLAIGQERDCNSPAHGAFQHYVVLRAALVSPIPAHLTCEQAVVLPLAVATASTALFGRDHLALALPEPTRPRRDETVLVWGGSTSVGCNAIQLAHHAGYRVITTASPHNHPLVLDLGASQAFDYRDPTIVSQVSSALRHHHVAGILAIGAGSTTRTVRIAANVQKHGAAEHRAVPIASVHPSPVTSLLGLLARWRGVRVSTVWGGTVAHDRLGAAIFTRILPPAMAAGTYHPAPISEVVGEGLNAIPAALDQLRRGVSARKLVVTIDQDT